MAPYIVFFLTHIILLLGSISQNAISVAFGNITEDFGASLVVSGWIISIYPLVAVCTAVLVGKLTNIFGSKKIFLFSSFMFILGSALCAIAPNIQLLIAARIVQSIGGGGLVPALIGLLVNIFPNNRQRVVALSMSFYTFGAIIGPSVGAWLLTEFGWRSIFWVNVPFSLAAFIPIIFMLKPDKGIQSYIDFKGLALLTGSITAIMLGLSKIGTSSVTIDWVFTGILLAFGSLCLTFFIRHEFRHKDPIIDLELLRGREFFAANVYNLIYGAAVFGISSFVPLFVVTVYGMSAIQSGIVLSVRAVGTLIAMLLSSAFCMRWGYRKPLLIGSILIAASTLVMAFPLSPLQLGGVDISVYVILCAANFVFGFGMGIATPASNNCCIDLIPSKAALITAVFSMFRQGGGAIFVPIITVILENSVKMSTGFSILFIVMTVVSIITIPFVFRMPEKAPSASKITG